MSKASRLERQMQDLINEERAAVGRDPLRLELRLNEAAEDHSEWMLDADRFSHTGDGNSNPGDRMRDADFDFTGNWAWGENIAWQSERGAPGLADDVQNLHDALMNSPGHRANILSPNFEVVGIGIERGSYNGWDAVMVTQNFARTGAPLELDPPATPEANTPPRLRIDDVVVAKTPEGRITKLKDIMTVKDAENDDIVWFELLDRTGVDNFRFKGDGRVDASTPYRVDAEDLNNVRITYDRAPGDTSVKVRAFDGEDVGPWRTIDVTTLSPDDWYSMA